MSARRALHTRDQLKCSDKLHPLMPGALALALDPSDRVDLCSLRSLTRVPSIGTVRRCHILSWLKHGDHAMESLSNGALCIGTSRLLQKNRCVL